MSTICRRVGVKVVGLKKKKKIAFPPSYPGPDAWGSGRGGRLGPASLRPAPPRAPQRPAGLGTGLLGVPETPKPFSPRARGAGDEGRGSRGRGEPLRSPPWKWQRCFGSATRGVLRGCGGRKLGGGFERASPRLSVGLKPKKNKLQCQEPVLCVFTTTSAPLLPRQPLFNLCSSPSLPHGAGACSTSVLPECGHHHQK